MRITIVPRQLDILCLALVSSGLLSPAEAQEVEIFGVIKNQQFRQETAGIVRLAMRDGEQPLSFECFVEPTESGVITSASVTPADGTAIALQADGGGFRHAFGTDILLELDANYPDGNYSCHLVTGSSGPLDATLSLSGGTYPNIPRISNFQAAQAISAGSDFTITWDAFTDGTTDDFIEFAIEDENGNDLFHSGPPGPSGLNGTDTGILIPASTLSSGKTYQARLMFANVMDAQPVAGALAVAAFTKTTEFKIRTSGTLTDTSNPSLTNVLPYSSETGVPVRSVVAFHFDEAMNPGSLNLQWTGSSLNPALFGYQWNTDGRVLSAVYSDAAGLPASTEIFWQLNATDLAGNLLSQQSGSFTTSGAPDSTAPDVSAVFLIKNHFLFQDSGGVHEVGRFTLEVNGELRTMNGVTSGSVTTPGGGTAALETDYGDECAFEANYTTKADMDRFFANGGHSIVLNTAHDGTKTATLGFPADAYPSNPTVTGIAALQAADAAQGITVSWSPFAGGATDDIIILELEAADGDTVFSTPDPGMPGGLDGLSTSVQIPSNTLSPGRTYQANLIFARPVDLDPTGYTGVTMASVFAKTTVFEVTTSGTPLVPKVTPIPSPGGFQLMVTGDRHVSYLMEASTNLQTWYEISYPQATWDGTQTTFTDGNSGMFRKRFYRVREITDEQFYQRPVAIEGMVVNGNTGTPLAGAVISTSLDGNTAVSDADGLFFLQTGSTIDNGYSPYSIAVSKAGFQPFSGNWSWGNQPRNQWFSLNPQP